MRLFSSFLVYIFARKPEILNGAGWENFEAQKKQLNDRLADVGVQAEVCLAEAAGTTRDFRQEVMTAGDSTTRSGSAAHVSGTPAPGERAGASPGVTGRGAGGEDGNLKDALTRGNQHCPPWGKG